MARTLRLPNGETVTEEDLILYNGYPYRVHFVDDEEYEFELAPLYWGDSGMDVPFADREALEDQWESDSRGTLSESEWERWVADARRDSQFSDEEVNEIARELSISTGLLDRIRQLFSR